MMIFAKMTGSVETWQSSLLIRTRQWSQCLITCWSKGSSQCFCMLILLEKFLEAFETHLGMNGGISQFSRKPILGVLSNQPVARKAPDVAILQITGTDCFAGWLQELGDEWWGWFESVFVICIYCMYNIYIYIAYNICREREREEDEIYRVQFVGCSMQIKNKKPLKRLFEVGDWSS